MSNLSIKWIVFYVSYEAPVVLIYSQNSLRWELTCMWLIQMLLNIPQWLLNNAVVCVNYQT